MHTSLSSLTPYSHRSLRAICAAPTLLLCLALWLCASAPLLQAVARPAVAIAETADDLIKLGNTAYEEKKYREAVAAYTRAIQTDPSAFKAYRNMAFTYDQLKEFNFAAHYYDFYFEFAPEARKDRQIQANYKRVTRARGNATPLETPTQQSALARLQASLTSGPYLTEGGGGAIAHYDLLIRTGFATPALIPLQKVLGQKLLEEAAAAALPAPSEPVPTFGREGWKLIIDRVNRADSLHALIDDPTRARAIALVDTAHGWDEYLRQNYPNARARFQSAATADPKLAAAAWGLTLATMQSDKPPFIETLSQLERAEGIYRAINHDPSIFVAIVRANLLQRADNATDAARILQEIQLPASF
jgi:tetratricopeptide (TPR) repeat protein